MILCLDVGNSHIYGGVYKDEKLMLQFRKNSKSGSTSDEIGLFLKSVLRENDVVPNDIQQISLCTVVPEVLHSLRNACRKYFDINPFVLQAGVKTGLKIKYRNPIEVGSDRIANAISAIHLHPNKNLLVVDFGTATTFCAISKEKEYLGGVIMAGPRLSMMSLDANTSKLPSVEIVVPDEKLGRSTVTSIQSGLYYGSLGAIKEIKTQITQEAFDGKTPLAIVTGGFSRLFQNENVFDEEVPELVLEGLRLALKMNA